MSATNNSIDSEAVRVAVEDIRVGNGRPRPGRSHSDRRRFNPINITFEISLNNYANNMPFTGYGDHSFTQLDSSVGSFGFYFNNPNSHMVSVLEEVDLESGQLGATRHNNISSNIYDRKQCRICHMNVEDDGDVNNDDESVMEDSEEVMKLGCNCKGDMGTAHQRCAVTWFRIKGNSFKSKEDLTMKISNSVFVTNFPDHFTAQDLLEVRFQRESRVSSAQQSKGKEGFSNSSFASVLKIGSQNPKTAYDPSPAIVLDDSCFLDKDMLCSLMGKIKDINALSNLYALLANEGFDKVNLMYLGGFWVLIDMGSTTSKEKMCKHVGVASWFYELLPANDSFVSEDRLGSLSEVEDEEDSSLPYKKLYIRVKELEAWSPDFNNYMSDNDTEEDESDDEKTDQGSGKIGTNCEIDKENEVDHVSESSYMNVNGVASENNGKSQDSKNTSKDPFGIYNILNRKPDNRDSKSVDPIIPPGFTPVDENENVRDTSGDSINQPMEDLQTNKEGLSSLKSGNHHILNLKPGGSILEVMESLVEIGQTMGYNMEGCVKILRPSLEINRKHKVNFVAIQETKMEDIGLFTVKALWGSFSYDFPFSPFVGSSGGILCVWDPNMFIKDSVSISDSFLAIRGDFNEVRTEQERFGTVFNALGANAFNQFIASAEGLILVFPSLSSICLDRHLSDHRPILMRELVVDYGPTPFRIFNSWFSKLGFDILVEDTWNDSTFVETNYISLLKKKFQALNSAIKSWSKEEKHHSNVANSSTMIRLVDLDRLFIKKAKIRWSIEGDENSKYFHGILNKKRSQLVIRGVLVEGDWIDEPALVKNEFLNHFTNRFSNPNSPKIYLGSQMLKNLTLEQVEDLVRSVTYDEIKRAIWDCGTNKSLGPDGFTFDFIRRYWKTIDKDVVKAMEEFFVSSNFPPGSNASFITLIPKTQILDGPFILNELISWCKSKKTKAMIFKVDFEKAFDSVRWDFLVNILNKFGFGAKWRGLKQGDPLSHCLFILIMESLHLSFNHILNVGLFKGIQIDNSLTLSHLFYVDDVVFIGKWDKSNCITIVNMLKCFFLASGLKINIHKSKLMGIVIPYEEVILAANFIRCSTLTMPFNYLGVKVGAHSSRSSSWEENFFNGVDNKERKLSMTGWKKVLASKNKGSLGSLSRNSPWSDNIKEVAFLSLKGINFLSYVKKKVGNGEHTCFWEDVWLDDHPLKLDGIEEEKYLLLVEKVASMILSNSNDRWTWSLASSGEFSVKSARIHIDDILLPSVGSVTR
nr:RNA-directed DNA polymerase, eukaryota [Tanacetum cinerariifolium]